MERHAGCRCSHLPRRPGPASAVWRPGARRGATGDGPIPRPARARCVRRRPALSCRRPALPAVAPVTLATVLLALGLLFGRGASSRCSLPRLSSLAGTPTQTATQTHTPTAMARVRQHDRADHHRRPHRRAAAGNHAPAMKQEDKQSPDYTGFTDRIP